MEDSEFGRHVFPKRSSSVAQCRYIVIELPQILTLLIVEQGIFCWSRRKVFHDDREEGRGTKQTNLSTVARSLFRTS